jgi:hypothetical protein
MPPSTDLAVLSVPNATATTTELTATTVPVPEVGPVAIKVTPTKLFSAPTVLNNESPNDVILYATPATNKSAVIDVRSCPDASDVQDSVAGNVLVVQEPPMDVTAVEDPPNNAT